MTTTVGLLGLGSVDNLMSASWSGFDYPQNAVLVPLLGDGTSTVNAALQQGALTVREGTVGFDAVTADAETIRGYYENHSSITFTDYDGSTCSVRVLDYSRSLRFPGVWSCSVTLLQLTEPVPLGA